MVLKETVDLRPSEHEDPAWVGFLSIPLHPSTTTIQTMIRSNDDDPNTSDLYEVVSFFFDGYGTNALRVTKKSGNANEIESVIVFSTEDDSLVLSIYNISKVVAVNDNKVVFQGFDDRGAEGELTVKKTKTTLDSYFSSLLK